MKYGVHLPNFGAFGDASVMASLALDAERAGWDGFFIWDHVTRSVALPNVDPWVALTAIASVTNQITIGPLVTPLPRRRPWILARESVSVDRLSGGRLVLGYGSGGGGAPEWDDLGEASDLKTRTRLLDEALSVLTGLWTGEPFSFDGVEFHIKNAHFLPSPLRGSIPLWGAGYWPARAPFKRALKYDGIVPLFQDQGRSEVEQLSEVITYVKTQKTEMGDFDIAYLANPRSSHIATPEESISAIRDAGATWWIEEFSPNFFVNSWAEPWPFDLIQGIIRSGPPGK